MFTSLYNAADGTGCIDLGIINGRAQESWQEERGPPSTTCKSDWVAVEPHGSLLPERPSPAVKNNTGIMAVAAAIILMSPFPYKDIYTSMEAV